MSDKNLEIFQVVRTHHEAQTIRKREATQALAHTYGISSIQAAWLIETYERDPKMLAAEISSILNRGKR